MNQITYSPITLLLFLISGLSLQAQQKWNPQNKDGAFIAKVERALYLTESQVGFAKDALDLARPYTREEFKNMSPALKKTTKASTQTFFFDKLTEVLTEAQKTKLIAFKRKMS